MAEAEKDDYEVVDLPSEASTPPKKPVAPLKPGQYRLPSGEATYRSADPLGVSGAAQDFMARQGQYGREGVSGAQAGLRNLGNIPERLVGSEMCIRDRSTPERMIRSAQFTVPLKMWLKRP